MAEITEDRVKAGIALYTKPLLFVYDLLLLGCGCRFLWRCPSRHILEVYNKCITANHLDIGVGTGYFMDKCNFPSTSPRLALLDLNPNSLNVASKRLSRYHPEVYRRNALEPFRLGGPPFDSVALMNVLHCLPGNMKTKGMVFRHIAEVLNHDGIIFGSTILYKGVKRSPLATRAVKMNNRIGIMSNLEDTAAALRDALDIYFSDSYVWTIGCVAFFRARKSMNGS
jgi:hypothetical protein